MRPSIAVLGLVLGVLAAPVWAEPAPEKEPPRRLVVDLKAASTDEAGARLLNAALNQMSLLEPAIRTTAASVRQGTITIDLARVFNADQRKALGELTGDKPVTLATVFEALKGAKAPALDRIGTKKDLEALLRFDEARELPRPPAAPTAGFHEDATRTQNGNLLVRRRYYESRGVPARIGPVFEQWIVQAPNGTLREYFFNLEGKRQIEVPANLPPADARGLGEGGRAFVDARVAANKLEKPAPPDAAVWAKAQQIADAADKKSSSASADEVRRFLVQARRKSDPAPAVPAAPATHGKQ